MSIPASLPSQSLLFEQKRIRLTKRQKVYQAFMDNLGVRLSSQDLHVRFGSSVRTRISEINRDPQSEIVIRNRVTVSGGQELSIYWAERKSA